MWEICKHVCWHKKHERTCILVICALLAFMSPGNEDNSCEFPIYIARKRLYAVHGCNLCFTSDLPFLEKSATFPDLEHVANVKFIICDPKLFSGVPMEQFQAIWLLINGSNFQCPPMNEPWIGPSLVPWPRLYIHVVADNFFYWSKNCLLKKGSWT